MKKLLPVLVLAIAFIALADQLTAQTVIMGEKFVKSRGEAEYVIPSTDIAIDKPVLSRGGCVVKLDNWTGYYIDIWIDKNYKGRLNPWASNQLILPKNYTEVYCKSMGNLYHWKAEGECQEEFVLKLEEY